MKVYFVHLKSLLAHMGGKTCKYTNMQTHGFGQTNLNKPRHTPGLKILGEVSTASHTAVFSQA